MSRSLAPALRLAMLAALLPACLPGSGGDEAGGPDVPVYGRGSLDRDPAFPGSPSDPGELATYFSADDYGDPACDRVLDNLDQRRELRLFYHAGDFDIEPFTRGLERYYRRLGLTFYTRHVPLDVPIDWVADTNTDAMMEHLRQEFPDVDWESDREPPPNVLEAILMEGFAFTIGPILDFALTYGDQGQAITNVVLLPRLEREESLDTPDGQQRILLGLAISPTLLDELEAHPESSRAGFWRYFPLKEPFTPMLFINAGVLAALPARRVDGVITDLTIAHEMGHTFGLQHISRTGNLMKSGFESQADITCAATLDTDQIARIEKTLSAASTGQGTGGLRLGDDRSRLWSRLREHLAGRAPSPFLRP